MRAVLQRVSRARVTVAGETVGEIGRGLLALVAVGRDDGPGDLDYLERRIRDLRLFRGPKGHFDVSLVDSGGEVLLVSQFTLYGDTRRGRRPDFKAAAPGETAEALFAELATRLATGGLRVATGRFGADMQVELLNDGPVTLWLDSRGDKDDRTPKGGLVGHQLLPGV